LTVAPVRSRDVELGALELLGLGRAGLARRVAGAIADTSPERGVRRIHDGTVARLAIDEALLRGDEARAERRATRGHVARAEVAARALILERPEVAASIATNVVSADPGAGCAKMVLSALEAREGRAPAPADRTRGKEASTDRPAAACVLVFAERLAALGGPGAARLWAARVAPLPMSPHDPVTGPLAVDLAARGVVAESSLPLELRLELAARRREAPPAVDVTALDHRSGGVADRAVAPADDLDPKHLLLWHMLVDPTGAPAKTLLARMVGAADRDPIVGFSLARAALASTPGPITSSDVWGPVLRAITAAPAHPLLLAVAVEIATRGGRAEDVPPARARLMAVARTPAERALARE
jgi:hypothetical protein